MYELTRVRLFSVGPTAARYQDVALDLRGVGAPVKVAVQEDLFAPDALDRSTPRRPSPASVLFLENGGGKSVLLKLIFSVLLPGRRQVVGTTSTTVLENFVLAEDVAPSRLERAKLEIERVVEARRGDRVGLVVFAGDAFLQCPLTTDRGALALNDHARANDPFTRVGEDQVSVQVSSVIRASPDSFRVAWSERHYENGQLARTERWTAILTIVIDPPRTADRLRANPLGIYVNAINWSREMSQ